MEQLPGFYVVNVFEGGGLVFLEVVWREKNITSWKKRSGRRGRNGEILRVLACFFSCWWLLLLIARNLVGKKILYILLELTFHPPPSPPNRI